MNSDPAVKKCKLHIRQATNAIQRAWEALDGVEDPRKRSDLEFKILNLGAQQEAKLRGSETKTLTGLTPEQEAKVRRAISEVANAIYPDLVNESRHNGEKFTNADLMEVVCDQLYDDRPMNLNDPDESWPMDVRFAWLAIAPKRRHAWMNKEFNYI